MKNQKAYFYILTNKRKNVLYIGSTKDLIRRLQEHQKRYNEPSESFSARRAHPDPERSEGEGSVEILRPYGLRMRGQTESTPTPHNKGFTQRYNVNRLVYYEIFEHIDKAKDREHQVKGWRRQRKIELIEAMNKEWKDLYDELTRDSSLRSE